MYINYFLDRLKYIWHKSYFNLQKIEFNRKKIDACV